MFKINFPLSYITAANLELFYTHIHLSELVDTKFFPKDEDNQLIT